MPDKMDKDNVYYPETSGTKIVVTKAVKEFSKIKRTAGGDLTSGSYKKDGDLIKKWDGI